MSAKQSAASLAALVVGTYAMVWLFETPRGDRILKRVDRVLFPAWVTGEGVKTAGQKVSDGGDDEHQEHGEPGARLQK